MEILNIPNQLLNGPLTPLVLSKVDTIVLHHMAHPIADVKMVENWHVNGNGWCAIGYNYWIGFDGKIYKGRGLNKGAAVENHNSHIISIGFQGDYSQKSATMPDSQFNSGIDLILWLKSKIPGAKSIVGHKQFGGTICPGQYFPLEEMKTLKKRDVFMYNTLEECPSWAQPTIKKLISKGYLKGNEKGELCLNEIMLRILVINDRAGIYDL
ncbi:MAG: N-acetylmuramoyl-L-alanine amidase [Clostridia bacterium]|nr:N-acetylmuramoyl-L-alanine amidase [Clostridia bacterium]